MAIHRSIPPYRCARIVSDCGELAFDVIFVTGCPVDTGVVAAVLWGALSGGDVVCLKQPNPASGAPLEL